MWGKGQKRAKEQSPPSKDDVIIGCSIIDGYFINYLSTGVCTLCLVKLGTGVNLT